MPICGEYFWFSMQKGRYIEVTLSFPDLVFVVLIQRIKLCDRLIVAVRTFSVVLINDIGKLRDWKRGKNRFIRNSLLFRNRYGFFVYLWGLLY